MTSTTDLALAAEVDLIQMILLDDLDRHCVLLVVVVRLLLYRRHVHVYDSQSQHV